MKPKPKDEKGEDGLGQSFSINSKMSTTLIKVLTKKKIYEKKFRKQFIKIKFNLTIDAIISPYLDTFKVPKQRF